MEAEVGEYDAPGFDYLYGWGRLMPTIHWCWRRPGLIRFAGAITSSSFPGLVPQRDLEAFKRLVGQDRGIEVRARKWY